MVGTGIGLLTDYDLRSALEPKQWNQNFELFSNILHKNLRAPNWSLTVN